MIKIKPGVGGAVAAVAITIVFWASAFPLIHIGLRDMAPIPLAAARFAIAGLLVGAWLVWMRPKAPNVRDSLQLFASGAVGIALYNVLLNSGQTTVTAGAASFIVNTVPILTACLAVVFLKERVNALGWLGTAISFGGIGLIASGQPGGLSFGAGASFVLSAAVCQAIYFTLQRPLVATYGALACTAYTLLAGAMLLSPWLPTAVSTLAAATTSPATVWSVIALGVFPAAFGYATWAYALGHFGSARASNFLYLVPPVATALAFVLAAELPSTTTVLGGAIAIAGVVLMNTRGRA